MQISLRLCRIDELSEELNRHWREGSLRERRRAARWCLSQVKVTVAGDADLRRLAETAKMKSPAASPASLRRASGGTGGSGGSGARSVRLNVSNAGLANKLNYIADQGRPPQGSVLFWQYEIYTVGP